MKILITGSAGHLGECLMRALGGRHDVVGLDERTSAFTTAQGSILDRAFVRAHMKNADAVVHAATLHKPHVATHAREAFVDVNVTGTLVLLEETVRADVGAFVYTSSTSVFGRALTPAPGARAAWITEDVRPVAKNIYGVTKAAAENLCELFHHTHGLPCIVLRASRFFPEEDDNHAARQAYENENLKANEFLFRRVDLDDLVEAHELAVARAPEIGFARYIVSATTPFTEADLAALRTDAPAVVARLVPAYEREYARRGWTMHPSIDRVYVNDRARAELGWRPRHDFARVVEDLAHDRPIGGALARQVGAKGYHAETFADGPYPVED